MKKLQELNKEIKDIESLETRGEKASVIKRRGKRVAFLKFCVKYLETQPSIDFIKKEKGRISGIVDSVQSGYTSYIGVNTDPRKWKAEYNKETGLMKLKEQLRTLNFLLN